MEQSFAIELSGVSKIFRPVLWKKPLVALRDINWHVLEGEIALLLGPNGSGKSTLLNILVGLLSPTHGKAKLYGLAANLSSSRKKIGFLPAHFIFPPFLNAKEILAFYAKLSSIKPLPEKIEKLLDLVELREKALLPISAYSQGMKQRLGLAQALIHDPKLLILDEPTAGLDPLGLNWLFDLFLKLKQSGTTILFTSHLLTHVDTIVDRIAFIHSGNLFQSFPWSSNNRRTVITPLEKLYFRAMRNFS